MNGHENQKLDQILEKVDGLKGRVHQLADTVCGPPGKPDEGLCWEVKQNGVKVERICRKIDDIKGRCNGCATRIGTLGTKLDQVKAATQAQQAESRVRARFIRRWGPWIAVAVLGAVAGGGGSEVLKGMIEAMGDAAASDQ